jgi:hypothetical protein
MVFLLVAMTATVLVAAISPGCPDGEERGFFSSLDLIVESEVLP